MKVKVLNNNGRPDVSLCAICLSIGLLIKSTALLAAPGTTYAKTDVGICKDEMIQVEDINTDGVKDFICGNSEVNIFNNLSGVRLISGKKNTSSKFPVLWHAPISYFGRRVTELKINNTKYFAGCFSTGENTVKLLKRETGQVMATSVAVGACTDLKSADIDGDGIEEVLISSGSNRRVIALKIQVSSLGVISFAPGSLFNFTAASNMVDFGQAIVRLGDITGDGKDEYAVSAPKANLGITQQGAVVIYSGSPFSTAPYAILPGSSSNELFGSDLSVTDIDGDGQQELLVGAPGVNKIAIYTLPELQFARELLVSGNFANAGAMLSREAHDANGDNIPDLAIRHSAGTVLVSGRDGAVLKNFANFTARPEMLEVQAEHDSDRMFASVLVGSSSFSTREWSVVRGDQYACPAIFFQQLGLAGVFGNGGLTPAISISKGCAVYGGQLKVDMNLVPNAPFILLASPSVATTLPNIGNTINTLVPDRTTIELFEVGYSSPTGTLSHIIRSIGPLPLVQAGAISGAVPIDWVMQTIQLGQVSSTSHPLGGGMCSSDGYLLVGM